MRFNMNASEFRSDGFSGRRAHQHSSRRRQKSLRVPKTEDDAIKEIDGVLRKWGVDPDKGEAHASFAKSLMKLTRDCFNSRVVDNWKPLDVLATTGLPADLDDALHILLEHNLKQVTKNGSKTTKRKTSDLINEKYDASMPFPPYNAVRGELVLSRAYKEIDVPEEDLDPLVRFTYSKENIKDYMLDQFGQAPGDELPSHFVRALVLYQAVSGHHCLKCKNDLLWHQGLRSDFCNLVCCGCGSAYSLCCVADSKRVEKLFDKKTHFRGSYAHFHQLKTAMLEASQGRRSKMFIIFATRSCLDSDQQGNGLPVFVAEIKGALPNLNGDSFDPGHIRIKSNIIFEPLNNMNPWFCVDVPQHIDVLSFSMKVFHGFFDAIEDENEEEDVKTSVLPPTGHIESKTSSRVSLHVKPDDIKCRQEGNLKKILSQIDGIKEKKERGFVLGKWEVDLLKREEKVLIKLKALND